MFCRFRSLPARCCRVLVKPGHVDSGRLLHVNAAQGLVDGPLLDVRHGLDLHLAGDGVDDVGVHKAASSELCKRRRRALVGDGLLSLDLLRDLLPLCAAVESGDGSIGDAGAQGRIRRDS